MGSANNGYKSQTKEKSLTTCSEKRAMGHQLNFSGTGRLKNYHHERHFQIQSDNM